MPTTSHVNEADPSLAMTIVSKYVVGATSHADSNILTLDARVAVHVERSANRIEEHPRVSLHLAVCKFSWERSVRLSLVNVARYC